jgi:hypothetical protein
VTPNPFSRFAETAIFLQELSPEIHSLQVEKSFVRVSFQLRLHDALDVLSIKLWAINIWLKAQHPIRMIGSFERFKDM